MFEALGQKFEDVFRSLRGQAKLTEDNVRDAMREVRMALLEADVNFKVVKDFTTTVREKALGADVLRSVRPGQMFVKIVHDEMVAMMGGQAAEFAINKGQLNRVLLLGLQGSGKTTFAGKLALWCKKQGFKPLLVACDIHRPAAIEQLKVVGRGIDVPVHEEGTGKPAEEIAAAGVERAKREGCNLVIVDTAGRLHIDEVKMEELAAVKKVVQPTFSFLVADAMTGQDAVVSAGRFAEGIGIDGVCLTKLDGDARGGAALSINAVIGRPIYFVGLGEAAGDLERFHPDRMASRILGMGDVLTLVEKAQEDFNEDEAEAMQRKLKKEQFSLQDFLDQTQKLKKMGSLKSLMGLIPGMGQLMRGMEDQISDDMLKPMEAMIRSMTPAERDNPDLVDGSRRKRIAKGSGTDVADVNSMLKEFYQMRRMMSQMMAMGGKMGMLKSMMGGGGMGGLPGMGGGAPPALPPGMMRGGAFNQKSAMDPGGEKLKPKHRRARDAKKKKKKGKGGQG
jgi:signal recognition particle subunit SRP54